MKIARRRNRRGLGLGTLLKLYAKADFIKFFYLWLKKKSLFSNTSDLWGLFVNFCPINDQIKPIEYPN